jgi:hypothetical protein
VTRVRRTKTTKVRCYLVIGLVVGITVDARPQKVFSLTDSDSPTRATTDTEKDQSVDLKKILKRAAEQAKSVRNEIRKVDVLRQVAAIQTKMGDISDTFETITFMNNPYSISRALRDISIKQAENGDLKSAQQTAARINEGLHGDQIVPLLRIAELQTKAGDRDGAKLNFERAIGFATKQKDTIKVGQLVEIASAQIRINDRRSANILLDQAFKLVTKIDPQALKGFEDPVAQIIERDLVKIAEAYATAAEIGGALRAVDAIKTEDRKKAALQAIVRAQVQSADISGAYRLTTLVGNNPNFQRTLRLLIMTEQARLEDLQGAVKTFETFYDAAWDRYLFHIVAAQIKAGDREGALRTTTKLASNVAELSQVAMGFAKAGDEKRAKEILQMAVNKAAVTEGASSRTDSRSLGMLVSAQAQVGDFYGALQTINRIPERYLQISKLIELAKAQVQSGDRKGSEPTLQQATTLVESSPKSRRWTALLEIGLAQSKAGYASAAKKSLSGAAEDADAIPDIYTRGNQIAKVAKAQAEVGDVAAALQTVKAYLPYDFDRNRGFENVAMGQAKRGEIQEALRWVNELQADFRASALLGIAKGILEQQQGDGR